MVIREVFLSRLNLRLNTPYKVSSHIFHTFEPIVVEVRDEDGRSGWAETVVGPGYTEETEDGAWAFCKEMSRRIKGMQPVSAKLLLEGYLAEHSHAASVIISALEMMESNPLLDIEAETSVPLLVPVQAMSRDAIKDEVERHIESGFRTLKVKTGFGVKEDLERVAWIQQAVAGRACLRLDANQAYDEGEGIQFVRALAADCIELLEQPCAKADWAANAAVARAASVPLMLDESIYNLSDIDRAASLPGVGYVKVKINKLGGLDRLKHGLDHIRARGLEPVLGNGVATDISCWMEACVARSTISNAGEMNGWLKLETPLFLNPLTVRDGAMVLAAGYRPILDRSAVKHFAYDTHTVA